MYRVTEYMPIKPEDIKNKKVYVLELEDIKAITFALRTALVVDGDNDVYDNLLDDLK